MTAAASVKKKSEPWPQEVFQFMRQHVEVLLLPSSHSSNSSISTGGKEIRDCRGRNEQEEAPLEKNQRRRAATTESGSGIEVELRTQSPLPEDWEQFLDLKTGELFYFHRGSCKRAKTDPRELLRQADESVRALVLKAAQAPRFFFTPKGEEDDDDDSPTRNETAAAAATAPALDHIAATCADAQIASSQTDSRCLEEEASESSHAASPSREEEEVESANSQEKCSKRKSDEHPEEKSNRCPSCGDPLACRSS
ncbi:unnamed protein product [Sphagnum troendelagicum]